MSNQELRAALEEIAAYEIQDGLNYYNARAMIERARVALSRSGEEAPQGWQPISTAPKDSLKCWLAIPANGVSGAKYFVELGLFIGGRWFDEDGDRELHQPTYWKPFIIPTPPDADAEGDGK